jgi:hypothetical protein
VIASRGLAALMSTYLTHTRKILYLARHRNALIKLGVTSPIAYL